MNHPKHPNRSQWQRLCRLARKELVEILRDRRTIITLVLMPLLVYPLMGIVVQKLLLQSAGKQSQVVYNIGFETPQDAESFAQLYQFGDQVLQRAAQSDEKRNSNSDDSAAGEQGEIAIDRIKQSLGVVGTEPTTPQLDVFFSEGRAMEDLVKQGQVDIGVVTLSNDGQLAGFKLIHDPGLQYSNRALQYIGKRLRLANDDFVRKLMASQNVSIPLPASYQEEAVLVEKSSPPALLTFVPLMLVLMTITGAVYPAIDLTAGERERGTMEILVSSPVPRLVILIGKFAAVLVVALLTAIANLIAMVVTIYALGLDGVIFGTEGVGLTTLGIIFVLLIVLAAFFSATLLCLTSFARSFKEAQAYLIPLMLVAFAPGLLSLTPNLQTTNSLAVVPLVNIVLVGRDLLAGQSTAINVVLAIVSTIIYGLLALSLAARVFGTDSILTGGRNGWSDLVAGTGELKSVPEISTAMFFLAMLFPAFIVIAGVTTNVALKQEATISQLLWFNALVTATLFVALPVVFSVFAGLTKTSTFFLYRPMLLSVFGAVMLGCAVWTWAYELEIATLSNERVKEFFGLFGSMKTGLSDVPLAVKLCCLAVVPAICEELTFRGFLLSAFLRKTRPWVAIVVTAVLFGMFHVFVRDALMFERMVPSTFMGLLLGFVCVRTGSIFPGMLLHLIHNGVLISLAHYESFLIARGVGVNEQTHLPASWILISLVPISIGLVCMIWARPVPRQR